MSGERKFVDVNVKRALLREFLKNEIKRAGYGGAGWVAGGRSGVVGGVTRGVASLGRLGRGGG